MRVEQEIRILIFSRIWSLARQAAALPEIINLRFFDEVQTDGVSGVVIVGSSFPSHCLYFL